jgi:alpha-mannosidase
MLKNHELAALTQKTGNSYEYLADSCHSGKECLPKYYSIVTSDNPEVLVCLIKKAEDDNSFIVRLLEAEGKSQNAVLSFMGKNYQLSMGAHEIKTIKIDPHTQSAKEVNLIEWQVQ